MGPSHDFHYHLLAAWGAWLGGRLGSGDTLCGLSILWWGRAGAVAGFVASLLLLWNGADSERFRRFALWLRETRRWAYRHDPPPGKPEPVAPKGADLTVDAVMLGGACASYLALNWLGAGIGRPIVEFGAKSHWNGALVAVVLFSLWIGVYLALLKFLTWLAEVPSFPHRLKVPAIVLMIVGFHFVLLAL